MNVRRALQIALDEESLEKLQGGEPVQIQIDNEQQIAVYPPESAVLEGHNE